MSEISGYPRFPTVLVWDLGTQNHQNHQDQLIAGECSVLRQRGYGHVESPAAPLVPWRSRNRAATGKKGGSKVGRFFVCFPLRYTEIQRRVQVNLEFLRSQVLIPETEAEKCRPFLVAQFLGCSRHIVRLVSQLISHSDTWWHGVYILGFFWSSDSSCFFPVCPAGCCPIQRFVAWIWERMKMPGNWTPGRFRGQFSSFSHFSCFIFSVLCGNVQFGSLLGLFGWYLCAMGIFFWPVFSGTAGTIPMNSGWNHPTMGMGQVTDEIAIFLRGYHPGSTGSFWPINGELKWTERKSRTIWVFQHVADV